MENESWSEFFYCPKCSKIILETEKESVAGDDSGRVFHSTCKTELVKRPVPDHPSDCYD